MATEETKSQPLAPHEQKEEDTPKENTDKQEETTVKDQKKEPTTVKEPESPPVTTAEASVKLDKKAFKEQFEAFAKFGDKAADGKTIKLSQSDKWFKQASLFEKKTLSTIDTGIAFRKVGKNAVKISFTDWNKYLDEIGRTKKLDANEIRSKLISCGKPGLSKTTTVPKSSALDRLTDPSRYGGTHKERFDASGKGKGKLGREDPKSLGYVSGYKHKGTYDGNKKN
eukprot:TRINITY_DN1018_c0_g1_i1.p1 TRINITY_DN1018_c0_g1~~TRINITY_DN1018_c0_g1_i1.p1  ORF type:complete len:226 (-),score=73.01 TRINITY_DN1018_c0_g1_i1:1406-2083(-)